MKAKDLEINRALKAIEKKRKEQMDLYAAELQQWCEERNVALSPIVIIQGGRIITRVEVVPKPPKIDGDGTGPEI